MKKILTFIKNWFEKAGIFKIFVAFVLVAIFLILAKGHPHIKFYNIMVWISMGYIGLTFIIFFIAALVNSIKDKK